MIEPEKMEQLADALVEELFQTGHGDKADRLVLTTTAGRNLGGWGKKPIRDRILIALRAVAEGRPARRTITTPAHIFDPEGVLVEPEPPAATPPRDHGFDPLACHTHTRRYGGR